MMHPLSSTIRAATFLLIMFIDGVGISLVLPLIPDLFGTTSSHSIVAPEMSPSLRSMLYGTSLAAYSLAMIFGATTLGQVSDRIGRTRTLCLALAGNTAGYLLCGVAVILKDPTVFLLGRFVGGVFAGSVPVAQAALLDMNAKENRMNSIGLVMFAVTSGYIFGPVIADSAVTFLFGRAMGFQAPFFLVAGLCVLGLLLLRSVPEVEAGKRDARIDLSAVFSNIGGLVGNRRIRLVLAGFFLFQMGWSQFYQFVPYLLRLEFGLSASTTAYVLTTIGVGMSLAFCWLTGVVQPLASSRTVALLATVSLLLLTPLLPVVTHLHWLAVLGWTLVLAIAYGLGYTAALVLVLSFEDPRRQGLILGSAASIAALSATVTALSGSYFLGFGVFMLLGMVSCCYAGTLLLLAAAGQPKSMPEKSESAT